MQFPIAVQQLRIWRFTQLPDKWELVILDVYDKILFTFLSPFTAVSILSENKAQTAAAIINNIENFSIFLLRNLGFFY